MLKHIPFYASLLEQTFDDGSRPTLSHVLVYGAVEAHSMGEKGCIASNKTIALECGLKESSVKTVLSVLNKQKWIKVNLINSQRQSIEPLMTINPPVNVHQPPRYSPLTIEYSNKNTVIENTSGEVEKELLKIINQVIGREFRTLPRGFKKTLDLFSLEEIKKSLTNMSADAWHAQRLKTLSSDYLLRATTIDKFLASKPPDKFVMVGGVAKKKEPDIEYNEEGRKKYLEMRKKVVLGGND